MEALYTAAHKQIRASPARVAKKAGKTVRKVVEAAPHLVQSDSKGRKWLRNKKMSHALKAERVQQKIAGMFA